MHSKIFQITQKRVEKDCYLNEDTLMQGAGSFFDYCGEIDEEERQLHIENLVNGVLPKGMFEFVSKDTIRYLGGADEWKQNFAKAVRLKAEDVIPEKVQEWIGPVYQLEKFLKNPWILAIGFTWMRMACSLMQSNPTSSCVKFVVLSLVHCFI